MTQQNLELRSTITSTGLLELFLEEAPLREPAPDEITIRVEAAPLNPSDLIQLLGPADLTTLRAVGTIEKPRVLAIVPKEYLTRLQARLDLPLPVGSEGAGTVVMAGSDVQSLLGRVVATRSAAGMYAQYRTVKAADCLVLPEGTSPQDGASAFINPLTVLGMIETMRREGHRALVHTAAASNLGQMLNRACLADRIPLVNIVRSPTQVTLLQDMGARHVLDSTSPDFQPALIRALADTGATLAFDAIGGGRMAALILAAMEEVQSARSPTYSRYGSPVHKQVYIYGVLDPGPKIIAGNLGSAWGVGGWLMTWFYQTLPPDTVQQLRDRVAAELTTTFASRYSRSISLREALLPTVIAAYTRRATGQKYLLHPA